MLFGLLAALSAPPARAASDDSAPIIPPGRESLILGVVAPHALMKPVAAGYLLRDVRIEARRVGYVLAGDGRPEVTVLLELQAGRPRHRIAVEPAESSLPPDARAAVEALRARIEANATDAFWDAVLTTPAAGAPNPNRAAPKSDLDALASKLHVGIALAFALVALVAWLAQRSRRRVLAVALSGLAMLVAIAPPAWWRAASGTARLASDDPSHFHAGRLAERLLVEGALWAALAGLALALVATVRALRDRDRRAAAAKRLAPDVAFVAAWSLFVRFALTTPNVLTDGGSGYSRLLDYSRGFGGLSVLVDLVLPDRPMWDSIAIPRFFAALAAPLVVVLARMLGLGRVAALLGGLALASIPLHAALYASDFEVGALVAFEVLGLALVAAARRLEQPSFAAAGALVLAYAIWFRPDALTIGLPFALILLWTLRSRTSLLTPSVAAACAWLATMAWLRLESLRSAGVVPRQYHWSLFAPYEDLPYAEYLGSSIVAPWWIWLPLVPGLLRLRALSLVALAGVVAGFLPLHLMPAGHDRTETYLEFFRYTSQSLPWLVLLAGAGLALVVDALGRVHARASALALVAAIAAIVATPLANRSYLARRYGPAVEEEAFLAALRRVPEGCWLLVPDDTLDGQSQVEVSRRYVGIAQEAAARGEATLAPGRVMGLGPFVRAARRGGFPSPAAVVDASAPAGDDGANACWYFFKGTWCFDGIDGTKPSGCSELEARVQLEPVATFPIDYRSHRLVSRPDRAAAPFFVESLPVELSRVTGVRNPPR